MNERLLAFTFGLALGLLLGWGLAEAHDFAEVLNSYGWGNSPEWLRVVCVNRNDCWT